jgi:hypothetical protein
MTANDGHLLSLRASLQERFDKTFVAVEKPLDGALRTSGDLDSACECLAREILELANYLWHKRGRLSKPQICFLVSLEHYVRTGLELQSEVGPTALQSVRMRERQSPPTLSIALLCAYDVSHNTSYAVQLIDVYVTILKTVLLSVEEPLAEDQTLVDETEASWLQVIDRSSQLPLASDRSSTENTSCARRDKQPFTKVGSYDITRLLERLETLEERCGITLSGTYAQMEVSGDVTVKVTGEIHSVNATELRTSLTLQMAVYDKNGRVVQTDSSYIDVGSFLGFDTFSICCRIPNIEVSRILVFPKPG